MPFFNGDLKDNFGYRSSMRFNTRVMTLVSAVLIICLGAYIIISAIKGNMIDGGAWAGMGSFLTGIGVIIGGSYYSQQAQKKSELNFQMNLGNSGSEKVEELREENKSNPIV